MTIFTTEADEFLIKAAASNADTAALLGANTSLAIIGAAIVSAASVTVGPGTGNAAIKVQTADGTTVWLIARTSAP
jgi:hypothetical protein